MSFCLDNLTPADRERIARELFEVKESRGHELHGLCPFHQETKPSFSYNIDKDLCNCFSCGASGDLITMFGQAEGLDEASAFITFKAKHAPDAGGTPSGKPPLKGQGAERQRRKAEGGRGASAEVTKIIPEKDWDKLSPLPEEWRKRCRDKFGWSDAVIDRFGLRLWSSPDGKEKRIAIPVRNVNGALVNVRLYLPGAQENKIRSWAAGFGKSKLLPSPDTWGNGTILICEGEKDTLCALSNGFNACTQTAGCNSWDDKFTRFFTERDVVIAYDADEKGVAGAKKVAEKLLPVAKRVRIITWPDYMGMVQDHGKDLTDFFMEFGKTAVDLKDIIADTQAVQKPSPRAEAIPDDIKRFFGGARGTQFKPRLVADEIMSWRKIVHDPKSGVFYSWNDRLWEEYDQANIRRHALTMLGVEGTTPRVTDILGIVRDLSILGHGRVMNDRENMIPLTNGMFSLSEAKILPHDPEHYNTYALDISLDLGGSLPDCVRWKGFLEESVGDPDTQRELQKFFGYCFTRETRHEKALLLIGPGGDGKGTILKVLQSLLGAINVSNVSMGGLEDQFHRVMLVDKLLNVTTEIEAGLLQSDIFKSIVSGEAITAAYKHKNAFSFAPVCKLAFSANKHPNIQDTSEGLYRRLLMVEMNREFVKKGKADLYLFDKLMEEKNGIFLWGLRGLQLLREEGFRQSDYMAGCLDRFKELNNPILSFVNTHVELVPTAWTCTMKVYEKYSKFCGRRNYKPLGEARFGIELRKLCAGISKVRQGNGRRLWGYQGIDLVDDYDSAWTGAP
jgi:putative DNA primase/helicase